MKQYTMKALAMTLSLLLGALISYSQTPNYNNLWYEHDLLNATTLDGTNWTLFSGGCGAGQGVDAFEGPIELPFDFCFYNTTYDVVYLSTKGVLTFLEPMCDWTPDAFPEQSAFNMIAGFWAGFDFTNTGLCYYDVEDHYAVFTFEDVGYSIGMGNLRNTFQMIISDGTSNILPAGNNVGLFYHEMEWAHSNIGGTNGFNGPNPAIVGVDKASGTDHIQFGAFNYKSDTYNGPYEESGVYWLNNKNFIFNTCGTENKAPVSNFNNAALEGDFSSLTDEPIQLCIGDTIEIAAQYFGPEQGQVISLDIDNSNAENFTLQNQTDGEVASWSGTFIGNADNVGFHELVVSATDNGVPVAVTTQTIVVEVLNEESPVLEILGDSTPCPGGPAELTAMPDDLDFYSWSNGCQGTSPDCDVYAEGWVTVTGYDGQCFSEASVFIDVDLTTFPPLDLDPPFLQCPGDTMCISLLGPQSFLESYHWSCFDDDNPDYDCNIYSDSINDSIFYCGPGTYTLEMTNTNGCGGVVNFYISSAISDPQEFDTQLMCGSQEPFEFEGGYSEIGSGYLIIYFSDVDAEYANGSWLNVSINGETSQFAMNEPTFSLSSNEFPIEYGDEICIEYIPSPEDDGNNVITIFNCGNDNDALCGSFVGYSNSPIEYALCDTTYTGQILEWCGQAGCEGEILYGDWSQESSSSDGLFSNNEEYNSIFTPLENGVYDLTFIADEYGCVFEYQLIYDDATTFDYLDELVICDTTIAITLYGEDPLGGYFSGNGVTGNIFDPAIAGTGTHQICYTYPQLYCDSTVCIEMVVDDCNSINDIYQSPFNLYPNPTSGLLTIDSPFYSGEIYVYDAVGKLVLTQALSRKTVIEANAWSEGFYILHIHTSDGVYQDKIEIIK